jgi:hypothetical protein
VGNPSWIRIWTSIGPAGFWNYQLLGEQGRTGTILHTSDGGDLFFISGITPNAGDQNTVVNISDLAGSLFQAGATVRLQQGATVINATNVVVVDHTRITCTFDLTNAPTGAYDVIVTNPGPQEAVYPGGFTVNVPATPPCGSGGGAATLILCLSLGLLSLAGTGGIRRKLRKK